MPQPFLFTGDNFSVAALDTVLSLRFVQNAGINKQAINGIREPISIAAILV